MDGPGAYRGVDGALMVRRGRLALLAAGLAMLAACSGTAADNGNNNAGGASGNGASSVTRPPGSIGAIPRGASGPEAAGTISFAELSGQTPNWILPILTSSSNSVFNSLQFEFLMWRPIYFATDGVTPAIDQSLSPANLPSWSNGGRTFTITLKGWKWSNGQPITATDLAFSIDMIKAAIAVSPANWSQYTPGYFPDDVQSISTPDARTIVVTLAKAVNPTWLTENILGNNLAILPSFAWAKTSDNGQIIPESVWSVDNGENAAAKQIVRYLFTQSASTSTYATNPLWKIVDGPYVISRFDSVTGQFLMIPNPEYSGPHAPVMSSFEGVPFVSEVAEWNAVKDGAIDVAYLPGADIPQIPQLSGLGYNYFGIPSFSWNAAFYNFADKTDDFSSIIGQLYMRQALQYLEDQTGQINAIWHGDAQPAFGPVPQYPLNAYVPYDATTNPYPFSLNQAHALLHQHGWSVTPGGVDTCVNPGSGSGQCGAGIPAGTKLSFTMLYYSAFTPITEMVEDLASNARQVGIQLKLVPSDNFTAMLSNYNDAFPADISKWEMEDFGGETDLTYPTQFGVLNSGGGGNIGDYSNSTANALINASVSEDDPNAVGNEASYFVKELPVLWQPLQDYTWVWKTSVSTTDPKAMEVLTQYNVTPEFWYLTK
jgi:peptide/nickel transport system substrate-binding protein